MADSEYRVVVVGGQGQALFSQAVADERAAEAEFSRRSFGRDAIGSAVVLVQDGQTVAWSGSARALEAGDWYPVNQPRKVNRDEART